MSCEYCKEKDFEIVKYPTTEIRQILKANFCPMCGEPLTEPRALTREKAEIMLLEKAQNENAYIVTRSRNSAMCLQIKAINLGLDIHFPLSYHEFMRGKYCGRGIKKFILEEVEHFVQFLSPSVEIEIYGYKPKENE